MSAYDLAAAEIDVANSADPQVISVRGADVPLALAHGRLAVEWIRRMHPDAEDTWLLAARAHHLRRWAVSRSTYPEGKAGYLRWRKDQKARHATEVAAILVDAGYEASAVQRVQALIRRDGLGSDPGAQAMEDAACLVFLETQLADMVHRFDIPHLHDVLRRTARKMSPAALALVADVPLTDSERNLLAEALTPRP